MVVVFALLKWVIPTFEKMFGDFAGAELPKLTQYVIGASHWFGQNFFFVVGGMVGGAYLFKRVISTDRGRYLLDATMLKLPLFGTLFRKFAVAKFTRTLGTMIASGVPILDALEIVAKAANNKVI